MAWIRNGMRDLGAGVGSVPRRGPMLVAAAFALLVLPGWTSPAPDVVLYTLPCLRGPAMAAARAFRAETGIAVYVYFRPKAGLIGLIRHRARDDVVMADGATLAALNGLGLLVPGSGGALGQDPVVLIGRAGQAVAPPAVLLARATIARPDATDAASLDGPAILAALAPGMHFGGRAVGVAETPDVVRAVVRRETETGLVYATDIAGKPGLAILARPDPAQAPPLALAVALTRNGQSAQAGRLVAFLRGDRARRLWRAAGLVDGPAA